MANPAFSPREDHATDDRTSMTNTAEPNAITAAERAVEAAQRIVVERLELFRLELVDGANRLVERIGLMMLAGFVIALGWCGLAVALVMVLANRLPVPASVALVAGVHVVVGIAFYAMATRMQGRTTT